MPTPKKPTVKNVLAPKLRFKEFKDEWVVIKLGTLIQIRSGFSPSKYNFIENGKYPFLKVEELNNSTKYQFESRFYTNEEKDIVPKGSVIFPKRGAAILNNKVRISAVNVLLDSNLMAVTPINQKLNAEFLYYKIFLEKLFKIADTSTIPQINNKHIEPYKIPLPAKEEQQKIAAFLSAVDEKIQQLTRKKELLTEYKKGVMQQLFSPPLSESGLAGLEDEQDGEGKAILKIQKSRKSRFRQDNGKPYPKWEEKRLDDLCDVRDGTHDSPKYYSTGWPLLTSKNLKEDGSINLDDVNFISDEDFESINRRSGVNVGDILFGMIGTIGNPAIVKSTGFAIKNVALVKIGAKLLNTFLLQYLKSDLTLRQFHILNAGNTQKFVSLSTIRGLKVFVPAIEEQQKIASLLTALDTKIESVNQQIAQTQTFKKGLLQQMFV